MATSSNNTSSPPDSNRVWNEFSYYAFARLVARKHNTAVPDVDLATLSDEELERRLRLLSELAHLPPV